MCSTLSRDIIEHLDSLGDPIVSILYPEKLVTFQSYKIAFALKVHRYQSLESSCHLVASSKTPKKSFVWNYSFFQ